MQEQLRTKLHQARLHLRRGDADRALGLFESARVLARDDQGLLLQILPDLVRCYYEVGKDEQARQFEEQVAYLRGDGGPVGPSVTSVPVVRARSKRRRWLVWGIIGSVVALGAAAGATYLVQRMGKERYATTPSNLVENIGLLMRVGRYVGEMNGENVVVEIPLDSGTCFAVHRNGLLLTESGLVADDPARTPQAPFAEHPKLALYETRLWAHFGTDAGGPLRARIVQHLEGANLTLLKVDHKFDRPLSLSQRAVKAGESVRVMGYPAGSIGLLEAGRLGDTLSKLERYLLTADTVEAYRWVTLGAYQCADSDGSVVEAGRFIQGAPHVVIRATTSAGHQGGPVLNEYQNVAGVIAPTVQAASQPTVAGSVYAVPASQVTLELDTILSDL